jgi:hypothetical protein
MNSLAFHRQSLYMRNMLAAENWVRSSARRRGIELWLGKSHLTDSAP